MSICNIITNTVTVEDRK